MKSKREEVEELLKAVLQADREISICDSSDDAIRTIVKRNELEGQIIFIFNELEAELSEKNTALGVEKVDLLRIMVNMEDEILELKSREGECVWRKETYEAHGKRIGTNYIPECGTVKVRIEPPSVAKYCSCGKPIREFV